MKDWLVLFPAGGRGDFLISILFGDILESDYEHEQIKYPNSRKKVIRMHDYGEAWVHGSNKTDEDVLNIQSFQEYNVIRIKVETEQEIKHIATLWQHKKPMLNRFDTVSHKMGQIADLEEKFKGLDRKFHLVIPFSKLWDINYLDDLCIVYQGRPLRTIEKYRILYNIKINQDILINSQDY